MTDPCGDAWGNTTTLSRRAAPEAAPSRTTVTMTRPFRHRAILASLAAMLLLSLAVSTADARVPRATHYRVGGAITLDTNLLSTSGTSAWAINEYLASKTSLPPLGAAFIEAEQEYGVNARFLVAAAMHESAWGTSYIARVKHNLFGYNAYDRDPFRYASAYRTFEANIDATAKFIKTFYLTPGGRWWGGAPTLRSMQQFWSSSHHWGVNVSQIASSIRLPSIEGRELEFSEPVVEGQLHGGDRTTVSLSWSGGSIPAGVDFVASWVPVELDADAIAAAAAVAVPASPFLVPAGTATTTTESPSPARPAITVAAARQRSTSRSVTLSLLAPSQPGIYTLHVDMRDAGRSLLPAAQRVAIPSVGARVWGDMAVSANLVPAPDGDGALVQITNTGRTTILAATTQEATGASEPGPQAISSVVTVTAAASNAFDGAPVLILSQPLASDLQPGDTAVFSVSGITAATGRATNWLSANLSVLGDPALLAAYAPVGAWLSGASDASTSGGPMQLAVPYEGLPTSSASPSPSASPAPPVLAMPVPSARPTPAPKAAPEATPIPTPKPTAAPKHVTRTYGEHSGAITYHGSWGNASGNYVGGSAAYSTVAGSTATLSFTGTSVSWIGPLGPTRGAALVLLDGKAVARVSLWRSSFVAQAILFKRTFKTAAHHALTIKVLSDPGHPYVAIDEFVVRT